MPDRDFRTPPPTRTERGVYLAAIAVTFAWVYFLGHLIAAGIRYVF